MTKKTYPNMRAEMARRGETLGDLADLLGINRPYMSRKINKKSNFTQEQIDIIVSHFDEPYEYLFADE